MRARPNRDMSFGFRFEDGSDPDVHPVERQALLELMGERQVASVERLELLAGADRRRRSRRSDASAGVVHRQLAFSGSWTDVVLDIVSKDDDTVDVRGVILPGGRVGLDGADRDFLKGCIANLWSIAPRSQPVSALGQFDFADVKAGPTELAISCGGKLMLADLVIDPGRL